MKTRWVAATAGLLLGLAAAGPALAFSGDSGCAKECSACHTLTKEEADKILGKLPDTQVRAVRESSLFKGFWEVDFVQKGRRFRVLMDFGKKHLLVPRQVIPVASIGKLRKVDRSKIPLKNAIPMGDPQAKHRIVVFDDPDCPYCRKFHKEMKKIVRERKDVAFDILLFPLTNIHPQAYKKSLTIQCKRSIPLLEQAFAGKKLPEPDCKTQAVDENIAAAKALGIGGTPAIVLPDGRLIPGYVKASRLLKLLDEPEQ